MATTLCAGLATTAAAGATGVVARDSTARADADADTDAGVSVVEGFDTCDRTDVVVAAEDVDVWSFCVVVGCGL
ncbi:hypothetical protein H7K45_13520 [Mycobacterium yunnanensis]|uniref:Uncharacterized protein n=1 Tax=Mycobacterium yunnanensis TaxID=368477 RepID=A0A9X2Z2A4_9MYCO|nr:hypothetical protein [Mycobacterium yunnanensis]MCV7421560.1 hypothetical protein [Mycobacterium yunnanensis]